MIMSEISDVTYYFCDLKSKDIDVEFIQSPGEHTWEFCDKHVKEFIKTLNLK